MSNANTNLHEVLAYLKKAGVYYLATVEGDQPRVRPFGAALAHEGKLYMVTGNFKKCYDQMVKQDKVEFSGMSGDGSWLRLAARVVFDQNRDVKVKALEEYPSLKGLYSADDGRMEVFYLKDAVADICSFSGETKRLAF